MKPGPCGLVTVTFEDTAAAWEGMPHRPVSMRLRGSPAVSAGGPYPVGNSAWRVSAIRQGVMPMKGNGDVGNPSTASILTPASRSCPETGRAGGLQSAGAGQLAIFPTSPYGPGPA